MDKLLKMNKHYEQFGSPKNPASSPGILLPEYRIDKFNVNPDLILKDLIEKGII